MAQKRNPVSLRLQTRLNGKERRFTCSWFTELFYPQLCSFDIRARLYSGNLIQKGGKGSSTANQTRIPETSCSVHLSYRRCCVFSVVYNRSREESDYTYSINYQGKRQSFRLDRDASREEPRRARQESNLLKEDYLSNYKSNQPSFTLDHENLSKSSSSYFYSNNQLRRLSQDKNSHLFFTYFGVGATNRDNSLYLDNRRKHDTLLTGEKEQDKRIANKSAQKNQGKQYQVEKINGETTITKLSSFTSSRKDSISNCIIDLFAKRKNFIATQSATLFSSSTLKKQSSYLSRIERTLQTHSNLYEDREKSNKSSITSWPLCTFLEKEKRNKENRLENTKLVALSQINQSGVAFYKKKRIAEEKHNFCNVWRPSMQMPSSLLLLRTLSISQNVEFCLDSIIFLLTKRQSFKKIQEYIFARLACNQYVKGARILCSGRVGGRSKADMRSKKQSAYFGETALTVFSSKLAFASTGVNTPFGKIGVKLWICYR